MLSIWTRGAGSAGTKGKPDRMAPAPWATRDRDLEEAIAGGTIGLRYQPQLAPLSGEVVAVEALARWSGTEGGEALFVRASEAGLDQRLSRLVAEKAVRRAAHWTGPMARLGLSINLLPADLAQDEGVDWLLALLDREGFPPARLTVEIVENDLPGETPVIAARLARLRSAGVTIAIDDFGTGYASLAWLTGLPIDTLKIDRALIADIAGQDRDRIVVRAMLHLAQDLGMKTVVEGVESAAQLALLADWGCDLYQGFLGSEPLDEDELVRFVRTANLAVA